MATNLPTGDIVCYRPARHVHPTREKTPLSRFHRMLALAGSALVASSLLAACGTEPEPHEPPPPDLARFYDQTLTFGSCAGYDTTKLGTEVFAAVTRAECGRLQVPLDYDHPNQGTAQIAVTRLKDPPATSRSDPWSSTLADPAGLAPSAPSTPPAG